MRRQLQRLSVPLKEPFATSAGVVRSRELLLLSLEDEDGVTGCGEAAPFEPYDGVSLDEVAAALVRDGGGSAPPQARAAEEMARLDLEARRCGRAVGEPGAEAIPVNQTLSAGPPEEVAAHAGTGLRHGYSCFKLKVGLPDDADRVAAVREAIGPWPALRLDAGGAWEVGEAIRTVTELSRYDLELVEQPCRTMDELAAVRRAVDVPIAADESVASTGDVRRAAAIGACDVVNVKLAASGGYCAARDMLNTAADEGLAAFLSSTLDGPWGIAAALQLAASTQPPLACGLATLGLFDARLARCLPPPRDGLLCVPPGPGLGVSVGTDVLAEVLVEELP